MKFFKKIYLYEKFITESYYFFYSDTCSLGWINSLLQYRKHFSLSFNETEKLQVFALYLPKFLSPEHA